MKERKLYKRESTVFYLITILLLIFCFSFKIAHAESIPDSMKSELIIGEDGKIWSPVYNFALTEDEVMKLARVVMAESAQNDEAGAAAVARVALNRYYYSVNNIKVPEEDDYADTLTGIVTNVSQFNGWEHGKTYSPDFLTAGPNGQLCAKIIVEVLNNPHPYGTDIPLYVHFFQAGQYHHWTEKDPRDYTPYKECGKDAGQGIHCFSYIPKYAQALTIQPVSIAPGPVPEGIDKDMLLTDNNGNIYGYMVVEKDSNNVNVTVPYVFDFNSVPDYVTAEFIMANGTLTYNKDGKCESVYQYILPDGRSAMISEEEYRNYGTARIQLRDLSNAGCIKHGFSGIETNTINNNVLAFCKYCKSDSANSEGAAALEKSWDAIAKKMGIGNTTYEDAQKYSPETIAAMQKIMSETGVIIGHDHNLANSYIKWTYKNYTQSCDKRELTIRCIKCNNAVLFEGSAPASHQWDYTLIERSCTRKWGWYKFCTKCKVEDTLEMFAPQHEYPETPINCTERRCIHCNLALTHNFVGPVCQKVCTVCSTKGPLYGIHMRSNTASACTPSTTFCIYNCGEKVQTYMPKHNMYKTYVGGYECELRWYNENCSNCYNAHAYKQQTKPTSPHIWELWRKVSDATCSEEGSKEDHCTRCGLKRTVPTPKLPHDYSNPVYKHQILVSCTRDGVSYATCTCYNCGNTSTEKIITPATGHNKKYEIVTQPTCSQTGKRRTICLNWGCSYSVSSIIERTPHSIVPASCTEPTHCKVCLNTVGSALGHEWTGIIKKTCSRCGATKWF